MLAGSRLSPAVTDSGGHQLAYLFPLFMPTAGIPRHDMSVVVLWQQGMKRLRSDRRLRRNPVRPSVKCCRNRSYR